jgi:type IV pilus assembly protein PilM
VAFGSAPRIGLDIGTSAVRVAWIAGGGRSVSSLVRFGQVALPSGAVEGGEIRDPGTVAEAISQLWKRTKLKTKRASVGVANQRVVVRQVDLPFMEEKDLRSSLRYQVAEHIPMPVDDAELDFQVIDDYTTDTDEHMMRVLIVAAAKDMVGSLVDAVAAAGLQPSGVDLTPFAVARAVSRAARGEIGVAGAEAIIDVGAGVTNIVVHHNGEPRFVRILLVGADDATAALIDQLDLSFEAAEAMKFDLGRGVGSDDAGRILAARVDALVAEIQGSIDYYLSLEDSERVSSVVITGGGSLTPGLVERLEASLGTEVRRAAPLSEMAVAKSGLSPEQVVQIEPVAAAAVGLALGATTK